MCLNSLINLLSRYIFPQFFKCLRNIIFRYKIGIVNIKVLEHHPQLFFCHEAMDADCGCEEFGVVDFAVAVFVYFFDYGFDLRFIKLDFAFLHGDFKFLRGNESSMIFIDPLKCFPQGLNIFDF